MFELIFTQKRKREFFSTSFAVILSAVALPIVLKAEFNFELILHITIFVFLSRGSCFKSAICIQNSLENAPDRLVFAAVEGRKNYSPERSEGSIHLDLPF